MSSPLSFFVLIQSLKSAAFHLLVQPLDELAFVNVFCLAEIQWLSFGGDHLGSTENADCLASLSVFEGDLTNNGHRWHSGLDLRSLFGRMNLDHSSLQGRDKE